MDILKNILHMVKTKSSAVSQITFDEDVNVPDSKPDVGRMIQKKGEVTVEEVQIAEGQARVMGKLAFFLLYVEDGGERRVHSLQGSLPINEILRLDGLQSGDKVRLKWEIEDLSLHLMNTRKLNVKAVVTFQASVDAGIEVPLPVGVKESEGISVKTRPVTVLELSAGRKDSLRIRKEILVASNKPNVHTILWKDAEIRGLELRAEEGKVTARGELFVFVLYEGEEEANPLQWLENAIPFTGEIECSGCTAEMIPNIEVAVAQTDLEVKPDSDGEERIVQTDVVLDMDILLYCQREYRQLLDVYTPKKECVLQRTPETLEQLLVRNFAKCRVSERLKTREPEGKILQICHSDGSVKLDEAQIVEDGILVQGVVQVRILYIISNDEMPFYSMESSIPFSHTIEAPGISEECAFYLRSGLEQLSTTMADSNEIEAKAVVNLNAMVLRREQTEIIRAVEERELDMEKFQSMPGIVCYIVQPGDTLWDIAKEFYTTAEEIRGMNQLGEGEPKSGDRLLVVKKV